MLDYIAILTNITEHHYDIPVRDIPLREAHHCDTVPPLIRHVELTTQTRVTPSAPHIRHVELTAQTRYPKRASHASRGAQHSDTVPQARLACVTSVVTWSSTLRHARHT